MERKRYRQRLPDGEGFHIAFTGAPKTDQSLLAEKSKPFVRELFRKDVTVIDNVVDFVREHLDESIPTASPEFMFAVQACHLDQVSRSKEFPRISCISLVDMWAVARVDGLDMDHYFSRVLHSDDWDILFYLALDKSIQATDRQRAIDAEIRWILSSTGIPFQVLVGPIGNRIMTVETAVDVRVGKIDR